MAIKRRTVRSCTACIKWRPPKVFEEPYSIGTGFNMNLVPWIWNPQKHTFSYPQPLTELRA